MHPSMAFRLAESIYPPTNPDPISVFFDTTMPGGTALISGSTLSGNLATGRWDDFVTVRIEVILEYEQTITELRKQLLHYRRLVSQLLGPVEAREDYEQSFTVTPIDPASVRVLNSIVHAPIRDSATFRDFDEREL